MSRPSIAAQLGYYGVIYLFFLLVVVIGYGPAQEYMKPITNLIFPEYSGNSMVKTVIVMSLMYWGAIGVTIAVAKNKAGK